MARKKILLAIPTQMGDLQAMICEIINDVIDNRKPKIVKNSIDTDRMFKDGFVIRIMQPEELGDMIRLTLEYALENSKKNK